MAEHDKDRLADLLSSMASGQEEPESEETGAADADSTPSPPNAPAAKTSPSPVPAAPPVRRIARPAAPSAPPPPSAVPPPKRPSSPVSQPLPAEAPQAQEEPAAEAPLPGEDEYTDEAEAGYEEDLGDDYEPIPGAQGGAQPRSAPRRQANAESLLRMKQTIIPILLTVGVLCLLVVFLGFTQRNSLDGPFRVFWRAWFRWPAIFIGVVLLALAAFTILQVRSDLTHRQQRTPPPRA